MLTESGTKNVSSMALLWTPPPFGTIILREWSLTLQEGRTPCSGLATPAIEKQFRVQ